MKLLLLLFFALIHLVPAYSQPKFILENARTGRQKEIGPGDRIKISFTTQYEQLKMRQQGRVVAVTDSTLSYTIPFQQDVITVALSQVTGIQKYSGGGNTALSLGSAALVGITWGLIESNNGEPTPTRLLSSANIGNTVMALAGISLIYNGLNALIYPVRKVNNTTSAWRLSAAR